MSLAQQQARMNSHDGWEGDGDTYLCQESVAERIGVTVEAVLSRALSGLPAEMRWSDRRVRVRRSDLREWTRAFAPRVETRAELVELPAIESRHENRSRLARWSL
jgi:hypothetical protein